MSTAVDEILSAGVRECDSCLESTWAMVNGLRMHARVGTHLAPPTAKPVVLVHGVGVSSRYLIPTAERLAPHFRVFAPDLPGFGRSERPPRLLDVPGLADALAAWMTRAGPGRAALLGNSMGCQVIIDLAARYPELVERAVLLGPTVDPQARGLLRQIGRGALDLLREPLSYWPLLAADYLIAGPIWTIRTLQKGVEDPLTAKLPRVRAPVLVLRGTRDPIAPRRWVVELARRLPHGRWAEVPGSAHIPNYTAPDALLRIVRPFLDQ